LRAGFVFRGGRAPDIPEAFVYVIDRAIEELMKAAQT